jgi:toxin-antitoxin system PIN domain toxin
MIVPDANLLVYAYDLRSPFHRASRRWWEDALSGAEPVGIPWIVLIGFVRLITHPTLLENPLTVQESHAVVRQWFECEHVQLLVPREATLARFFSLLGQAGLGGSLVGDALIAAHAEDFGATVYSNDRDFDRFGIVRRQNPLES